MSRLSTVPPPVLVLAGIVSVQFGGALAATLIPEIGAGGSVVMRLFFATVILVAVVRPRWRGHSRAAWRTVIAFGLALGLMNFSFYGSLAHLPIGVAVTIEFLGPLLLAAALSRRVVDLLAVLPQRGRPSSSPRRVLNIASWTGPGWAGLTEGACCAETHPQRSHRRRFDKLEGHIAMVVATVVTLPFGVASVPEWDGGLVAKGLGIAVLSSVLPYSLELVALRRMTTRVFGILLSLEPAVAALAGLLILGQVLHGWQLLGMGLVVLASAIVLGLGARKDPAESTGS